MLTMSLSRKRQFISARVPYYLEVAVVLIATFFIEVELFRLSDNLASQWLVLFHFCVLLSLSIWLWSVHYRKLNTVMPTIFVASTCILGPFGAIGTVVMFVVTKIFSKDKFSSEKRHNLLFPRRELDPIDELCSRLAIQTSPMPAQVNSFLQIITLGTFEEKAATIALLARQPKPYFSYILKKALNDAEPGIRVQAASVLAQWQDKMTKRWLELRKQVKEFPEDVEAHFSLASHLDEYAFFSLLDHDENQKLRQEALKSYQYCIDKSFGSECNYLAGRLLVRLGRFLEASRLFEGLNEKKMFHSMSCWYAECLFHLRKMHDLRQILDELKHTIEIKNPNVQSMIQLWSRSS